MSALARKVAFGLDIGDGLYLNLERDLELFGVRIGSWLVRLEGGTLVVREYESASNSTPLLKVPA